MALFISEQTAVFPPMPHLWRNLFCYSVPFNSLENSLMRNQLRLQFQTKAWSKPVSIKCPLCRNRWSFGSIQHFHIDRNTPILGDPGAASRDNRIFVVKVYFKIEKSCSVLNQFQKRLNCLLLITQKNLSGQSAKRSSRVTLEFSYTTDFFSSIRQSCVASSTEERFRKKNVNEAGKVV